jgi:hypothetical protein
MKTLKMLVAAGLLFGATVHGVAEDARLELAEPDGFTERFSGNTQVSGQFLTGLALDGGTTAIDLSTIRLVYPADDAGMVCVRLTSDDGRYWAANLYKGTEQYSAPPVIPLPTSYDAQLREYGAEGLLLLASRSDSCTETSGKLLLPAIFGDRQADAPLVAFVNVSQGRPSAWIERDGARIGDGSCERPTDQAKVTYSHLCRIALPAERQGGVYELKVAVKGLTGKSVEQSYAINLE